MSIAKKLIDLLCESAGASDGIKTGRLVASGKITLYSAYERWETKWQGTKDSLDYIRTLRVAAPHRREYGVDLETDALNHLAAGEAASQMSLS